MRAHVGISNSTKMCEQAKTYLSTCFLKENQRGKVANNKDTFRDGDVQTEDLLVPRQIRRGGQCLV